MVTRGWDSQIGGGGGIRQRVDIFLLAALSPQAFLSE